MNKLLATLVAGTFAVVASSAFAQGTPAPADTTKMDAKTKAKYDEKAAQDLSRNSANPADAKANVDKSKMDAKSKAKYDEAQAQKLSTTSTDPSQAKANVDASKMQQRQKMPDLSKLTKEQKQELYRQLQKENTGG